MVGLSFEEKCGVSSSVFKRVVNVKAHAGPVYRELAADMKGSHSI